MYVGLSLVYPHKLDRTRLSRTLTEVLEQYSIFTGRYISFGTQTVIAHGTGAVVLQYEESSRSIRELEELAQTAEASLLAPRISHPRILLGRAALLVAKLTSAADGCVLTVMWDHVLGDLHSGMLLMRAWAAAYGDLPFECPALVPDRQAYLDEHMPDPPEARSAVRASSFTTLARWAYFFARPESCLYLDYTWDQLHAIRDAFTGSKRVSINDAVCANLHVVMRRLSGTIEPTNLCLCVNYRKRLSMPGNIMGNLVTLIHQPVEEVDDAPMVAAALRQRLDDFASKHSDYRATMRVFDAHRSQLDRFRIVPRYFEPGRGDMMVSNVDRCGAYDLRFGASGPTFFCPITFGMSRLRPGIAVVFELPRQTGLRFTMGMTKKLATRLTSPEGQALLSRGESRWVPVQRSLS
jgi:hypothetical protein